MGWDAKFDEDFSILDDMIYPAHTFTKAKKQPQRKKKDPESASASTPSDKVWVPGKGYVDSEVHAAEVAALEESRSGRPRKEIPCAPEKQTKRERAIYILDGQEVDPDDKNAFLCSSCNQLEADDHTDLILCDGPCLQSWHIGCMGLKSVSGDADLLTYSLWK